MNWPRCRVPILWIVTSAVRQSRTNFASGKVALAMNCPPGVNFAAAHWKRRNSNHAYIRKSCAKHNSWRVAPIHFESAPSFIPSCLPFQGEMARRAGGVTLETLFFDALPKASPPQWRIERPENSPVDCFPGAQCPYSLSPGISYCLLPIAYCLLPNPSPQRSRARSAPPSSRPAGRGRRRTRACPRPRTGRFHPRP